MDACLTSLHLFSVPSGTDRGTLRAAQAHRLAPVHVHSPPLRIEGADGATADHNPGPSVVHNPALALRSQTGGRSGAAGGGQV